MTRRGIIAALLTGGFIGKVEADNEVIRSETNFVVEFQKGDNELKTGRLSNCRSIPNDDYAVECDEDTKVFKEPTYGLIVRYGNEEVKLTAREVMDALKQPTEFATLTFFIPKLTTMHIPKWRNKL